MCPIERGEVDGSWGRGMETKVNELNDGSHHHLIISMSNRRQPAVIF